MKLIQRSRPVVSLASRWLSLPALVLVWEIVSRAGVVNQQLFPSPSMVWWALVDVISTGELWPDLAASVRRAIVGYTLGSAMGIAIGVATGRIWWLDRALGQVIHVLRAFPPVAIVPLAITWFGISEQSKYFLIMFGVFFPVWVNTHTGMSHVNRTLVWAAQGLGASKWRVTMEVWLPAAVPHILAGMRAAIGIAFICVFVAEMAGAYEGVGFKISTSYLVFRMDRVMAYLFVLGGLGATADMLFRCASKRLCPWMAR